MSLTDSIQQLYQAQCKIPPLIEDMEGMKEYDMKDYYVRLRTIIKESDEFDQLVYDQVEGEKFNIEVNDVFDPIKDKDAASKILILGGAGVGKSTLMQYMAYQWSTGSIWKGKFDVVYRVTLKTLLNSSWKAKYLEDNRYAQEIEKEPLKYIVLHNIVRSAREGSPASKLLPENITFADSDKILFLLDGYDEIAHMDDQTYKALESQIFKQKNIILTSRPNAIIPSFKKRFERTIENIGLDSDGIDLYAQLYFKESNNEKYEIIDKFLQTNATIKNICNIPVNIAMLCYIFQQTQDTSNFDFSNTSQLYQQVVQKLGERYMSKEFKGSVSEGQSLKNKIEVKLKHLPEIKAIKHIAYIGMTGGGVEIEDKNRKESLIIKGKKDLTDANVTSIQKSIDTLNLKTSINNIVKYGLLKQEGVNQANTDYSFIHLSFQEYLTAQYLTEKFLNGTESEKLNSITYLLTHRNEPRLLVTLKFMAGIITNENDEEGLKNFWNSMICNVDRVLEFSLESKVRFLMNLLGQAKRKGVLDQRIPNLQGVIKLIDAVVINNIQSFKETLKDSDYLSINIQKLILSYVQESKDISSLILSEMRSPKKSSKQQVEPFQNLIDYIVDERKQVYEFQNNLIPKILGLELLSFIPHKFDQEIISSNILQVLNSQELGLNHKRTILIIFNSIAPKLKGELMNKLKQGVIEYILSCKIPELYEIFLESMKELCSNQLNVFPNFTERIFVLLQEILTDSKKFSQALTNIPGFIRYISSRNPTKNKVIQQLCLSMCKDAIQQIDKRLLEQEDSRKDGYLMQKILECIDDHKRSEIAKLQLKFIEDNLVKKNGEVIFNLGKYFESILINLDNSERQIITKNLINYFEKKIENENKDVRYFSCVYFSKLISFIDNPESGQISKRIVKSMQKLFETQEEDNNLIVHIVEVFKFVCNAEKPQLAKDLILPLEKRIEDVNHNGRVESIVSISLIISLVDGIEKVEVAEYSLLLFLRFIAEEDFGKMASRHFKIILKSITKSNRLHLVERIMKQIEIMTGNNKDSNALKTQCIVTLLVTECISQPEKSKLAKKGLLSIQQLIEDKDDKIKILAIESIRKLFEFIENSERQSIAKDLLKHLKEMMVDSNLSLRCLSCKTIPIILQGYDCLERSIIATDFLKQYEELLQEEEELALIASNSILQTIKYIDNLQKPQLTNLFNFLDKLIIEENLIQMQQILNILQYKADLEKQILEREKNQKYGIQQSSSLLNNIERSEFAIKIFKQLEKMLENQTNEGIKIKICQLLPKHS